MSANDDTDVWGELVGGINYASGKTTRIELRLKPDPSGRRMNLLVMRHTRDGRAFSIPIFQEHAREFAQLLDVAVRLVEERVDEQEKYRR